MTNSERVEHKCRSTGQGLHRVYPLLLMCWLGFALRVLRLEMQPFWFDEGLTVDLALAAPLYVLETIDRPPLYYLLVHAWVGIVGNSAFAFRFFSAWWAVLALPLTYRLGRRLTGYRTGLSARSRHTRHSYGNHARMRTWASPSRTTV